VRQDLYICGMTHLYVRHHSLTVSDLCAVRFMWAGARVFYAFGCVCVRASVRTDAASVYC